MSIKASGDLWVGDSAADLDEFIRNYRAGGLEVAEISHTRCGCGAGHFEVAHTDEEAARVACARCGDERMILDSEARWDDDDFELCTCPCDGEVFEVAVGIALENKKTAWASVGLRCVECGTLGVYADWELKPSTP